jgi:hypothetical protein
MMPRPLVSFFSSYGEYVVSVIAVISVISTVALTALLSYISYRVPISLMTVRFVKFILGRTSLIFFISDVC